MVSPIRNGKSFGKRKRGTEWSGSSKYSHCALREHGKSPKLCPVPFVSCARSFVLIRIDRSTDHAHVPCCRCSGFNPHSGWATDRVRRRMSEAVSAHALTLVCCCCHYEFGAVWRGVRPDGNAPGGRRRGSGWKRRWRRPCFPPRAPSRFRRGCARARTGGPAFACLLSFPIPSYTPCLLPHVVFSGRSTCVIRFLRESVGVCDRRRASAMAMGYGHG